MVHVALPRRFAAPRSSDFPLAGFLVEKNLLSGKRSVWQIPHEP